MCVVSLVSRVGDHVSEIISVFQANNLIGSGVEYFLLSELNYFYSDNNNMLSEKVDNVYLAKYKTLYKIDEQSELTMTAHVVASSVMEM